MTFKDWLRQVLRNENDPLAAFRERIVAPVSLAALLLLLVFAVNNFLQGRPLLGLVVCAVLLILLGNVVWLRRGRPPPVPYAFILVPAVAGIVVSVSEQGILGAFWSYPLTLILYFVVTRRMALLFSLAILLALTAAVAHWLEPALAVRVFATLLLSIVMINVVLNVLGDLQDSLLRQTLTDPLTGAYNRRYMDQAVGLAVELGRRHKPTNTLLVFDIDHFKRVNDRFGHDAGDEVLRRLVQLVRARLRKVDPLFRIGGEEFMVLLRDTDVAGASSVAEDLRHRVEAEAMLPGEVITISIGVGPQVSGQSLDEWVKAADLALYRAKNAGRNRVELAALA